jgi:hypothetical protein
MHSGGAGSTCEFSITLILSPYKYGSYPRLLWFALLCRKHMWRKSPRHMVKASIGRTPQLMAKLSMSAAVEKPVDGETLSIF